MSRALGPAPLPLVLDLVFWVVLLAAAVVLDWTRRGDRAARYRPGPAIWGLGAAVVHHAAGLVPVVTVLALSGKQEGPAYHEIQPLLRLAFALRPAATAFYFHHMMTWSSRVGWVVLPALPHGPTYVVLASLESSLVAAYVWAGLWWLRPAATGEDVDGRRETRLGSLLLAAAGAGIVVGGGHLFAQVQAVQPWGSLVPVEMELLLLLLVGPFAVVAPLGVVAGGICLLSPARRKSACGLLLALVAFWTLVSASVFAADALRFRAFAAMARRSRPLVVALDRFVREQGKPPRTLGDLVPAYIPSVPGTGMGAYPDFSLNLESGSRDPWMLLVPCPTGRVGFEWLIRSSRDAPAFFESSSSAPVRDGWVFVGS